MIKSVLNLPNLYNLTQIIFGAHKIRKNFMENYMQIKPNETILDIGCGTAEILALIPENVNYIGYDTNKNYINYAKRIYQNRSAIEFRCKYLELDDFNNEQLFDTVIMMGVLHHIDNEGIINILHIISKLLKQNGKLCTIDPCYTKKQNPIAKFLISQDRGNFVRYEDGYLELINKNKLFSKINTEITNKKFLPYTHLIMTAFK